MTETLSLNIDAGITVEWNANISGSANILIKLMGSGTFHMTGGSIVQTGETKTAVGKDYTDATASVCLIMNDGLISATTGYAIANVYNIEIHGGTVQATGRGSAIYTYTIYSETADILIDGGHITSVDNFAINLNSSSTLEVGGEALVDVTTSGENGITYSKAITVYKKSNITICDDAVVSVPYGSAIGTESEAEETVITVKDNAKITSTANGEGMLLGSENTVIIEGGEISSAGTGAGGSAIRSSSKTIINMSGGLVFSTGTGTGASAVRLEGADSIVDISGGKIMSTGDKAYTVNMTGNNFLFSLSDKGEVDISGKDAYGFYMINNTGAFNMSGGKISVSGEAIYGVVTFGSFDMTAGSIISTAPKALAVFAANKVPSVTGGVIFGCGNNQSQVLSQGTPESFAQVIAWNDSTKSAYGNETSQYLLSYPAGATAVWETDETLGEGLRYKNGLNTGFIPLGVTIIDMPVINTSTLDEGTMYSSYSQQIGFDGSSPMTLSITGLPAGLTYTNDGLISGTPSIFGDFDLEITLSNIVGEDTEIITLVINEAAKADYTIVENALAMTPDDLDIYTDDSVVFFKLRDCSG